MSSTAVRYAGLRSQAGLDTACHTASAQGAFLRQQDAWSIGLVPPPQPGSRRQRSTLMVESRCQHSASVCRLTACLGLVMLLTAAPAAVRGEHMTITTITRGAAVKQQAAVVQAQPAAVEASIAASARRGASTRTATIKTYSTDGASQQPAELPPQQLDSGTPGMAPIPVSGCPSANYHIPIELAYDGTITVTLDSGSADLAVASTACDSSCSSVPGSFPFDAPGDSGFEGQLLYGSAALYGEVFTEEVLLQGLPVVDINMLAITSQTGLLQPATCTGDVPNEYLISGILGFGPDEVSSFNTDGSIVGILADAGVAKVFATALCPAGGSLYVGGYDSSAITAPPFYTPLYARGDYDQADGDPFYPGYLIQVTSITMNGQDLGLDSANTVWLADTGTDLNSRINTVQLLPTAIAASPPCSLADLASLTQARTTWRCRRSSPPTLPPS